MCVGVCRVVWSGGRATGCHIENTAPGNGRLGRLAQTGGRTGEVPGQRLGVSGPVVSGGQVVVEKVGLVDSDWLVIEDPHKCIVAKAESLVCDGVEHKVIHNTESVVDTAGGHKRDEEHGEL